MMNVKLVVPTVSSPQSCDTRSCMIDDLFAGTSAGVIFTCAAARATQRARQAERSLIDIVQFDVSQQEEIQVKLHDVRVRKDVDK